MPGPAWLKGVIFANVENVILYPITLFEDIHPAIRTGQVDRYFTWPAFWQSVPRHIAYGAVLGVLYERLGREQGVELVTPGICRSSQLSIRRALVQQRIRPRLGLQPADRVRETLQRRVDRDRRAQVPSMRIGHPYAAHPGTSRSLQPGGRIFENDAGLRRDAEPLRGQQEKIGCRLPELHLIAGDLDVEPTHQRGLGQ